MPKTPPWFRVVVIVALLWNVAGLLAVWADLSRSAADLASLPAGQQALSAARPGWSIVGSIVAVLGGTLGCLGLLLRSRWSLVALNASLAGILLQDGGLLAVASGGRSPGVVPFVVQGVVLLVGLGLVGLARRAARMSWLA